MSQLFEKELSNLDRVLIELEVLDSLKLKAHTKVDLEDIQQLNELNISFNYVRHSLENEVRHLVRGIEAMQQEIEGLRRMQNESITERDVI